ncbi:hypothetical protein [Magnetospirillum sp. UT-4]|uniref:hypothetical protein n=1 Tax=Magnetospirillum sp. UT-4 TaxID=2681467 RepID=UPI00138119A5|nr:hypothetical protein [Magnetospirillum sp. UT-4]CAA7613198.1 conserved exported hypothetical protein [Magnetospirillum sp. UT-4]
MPARVSVLAVSLLALAGCAAASVPWQNPDLPKEQWSRDWSSCRRWAESQVGYREDESSSPFRDYDRAKAKKQLDGLAGLCMEDRGYIPLKRSSR